MVIGSISEVRAAAAGERLPGGVSAALGAGIRTRGVQRNVEIKLGFFQFFLALLGEAAAACY